ncbi:hypothetical protein E3N88_08057 [Mikania micrantha]|uniref:Late embryogenesis abundant protein LEA-2 subgroup domain-containing protein n=1 Tax=Mikania micrantha TaxID=192012 RepID=A0A5N6PFR4_9ASTR|nr:hypothetical protein E3N88_08057 [Mikania micrantha]
MADQSRPVTGYPAYSGAGHQPNGYPNTATATAYPYVAPPPPPPQNQGIIIFIMWLVLRPQIPQFRVETLTLSNFNISTNSLISGNWDARFTARNPNSKITLYYNQIEAAIFYKSDSISETTVPPFVQGTKNETTLRATFASLTAYLDDRDSINGERNRGAVNFNLRMMTRVRFQAGSWWARRRILRVYCPNLSVGVSANSSSGSLVGGSKQCSVGL